MQVPHLPVTAPSLESLVLEHGVGPAEAVSTLLDQCPEDRFASICVHDYFEGLLHPDLFRRLIERCAARGRVTVPLRDAARAIDPERLTVHDLARGYVPGFAGAVSWQGLPAKEGAPEIADNAGKLDTMGV